MKKTTIQFNANKMEHVFKVTGSNCSIRISNVCVHSPNESSKNKQSIEWSLHRKPSIKANFIKGSDIYTKLIDISFLEHQDYGRPIQRIDNEITAQPIPRDIVFEECRLELEYDKQYSVPDISVELELGTNVVIEEELTV